MNNVGRDNYKFGDKNIWRRWAWNRICYRSNKKPNNLIGLYLIGNDDDFKVALNKGFNRYNIFGIDINKEKVDLHRKIGGIGINISLSDAIFNWDESLKLDFVNADFCCGLNKQLRIFLIALRDSYAVDKNSMIVLNMLRGREGGFNNKSTHLEFYREIFKAKGQKIIGDIEKHRGIQAIELVYLLTFYTKIHNKDYNLDEYEENIYKFYENVYPTLDFYSYRSITNGVTNIMDSVSFKWPTNEFKERYNVKKHKNRISAAKAIRTQKLNHRKLT